MGVGMEPSFGRFVFAGIRMSWDLGKGLQL